MKIRKWAIALIVLLFGLVAIIAFVPGQRWWSVAALPSLVVGIYINLEESVKRARALKDYEEYDGDNKALKFFGIVIAILSVIAGLLWGGKWWTILTVFYAELTFLAGYFWANFDNYAAKKVAAQSAT